jgi:hypothetical protein
MTRNGKNSKEGWILTGKGEKQRPELREESRREIMDDNKTSEKN